LDAVEYHQVMFEGDFHAPSVYRGKPNPELDQAWRRITHGGSGSIRIPHTSLFRLNKSVTADVLGFPGEEGDGMHDAQSLLEVFHQLHCLVS
jgi:hypothetical protein